MLGPYSLLLILSIRFMQTSWWLVIQNKAQACNHCLSLHTNSCAWHAIASRTKLVRKSRGRVPWAAILPDLITRYTSLLFDTDQSSRSHCRIVIKIPWTSLMHPCGKTALASITQSRNCWTFGGTRKVCKEIVTLKAKANGFQLLRYLLRITNNHQ